MVFLLNSVLGGVGYRVRVRKIIVETSRKLPCGSKVARI